MGSQVTQEFEEPTKEQLLQELRQAVEELRLIEKGKLVGRPVKELLDKLSCPLPKQG